MAGVKGRSGGHNAKTVKEHRLQGTFQKVRHAGIKNPEPPTGMPVLPKKLDGDVVEEWARMIARLSQSKTMSTVDAGALYQYCRLFAETEALSEDLARARQMIDVFAASMADLESAEKVAVIQEMTKLLQLVSGHSTRTRQGRMAIRTYLVEFGLTPASRGRVKMPDVKPDADPWAELDEPSEAVN